MLCPESVGACVGMVTLGSPMLGGGDATTAPAGEGAVGVPVRPFGAFDVLAGALGVALVALDVPAALGVWSVEPAAELSSAHATPAAPTASAATTASQSSFDFDISNSFRLKRPNYFAAAVAHLCACAATY